MENNKCEHCAKHKHRTEKEYKSLVTDLIVLKVRYGG